jgi:hypothetical protein
VSGLFWVAFVEQALQGFWVASAYVTVRLPKAKGKDVECSINDLEKVLK